MLISYTMVYTLLHWTNTTGIYQNSQVRHTVSAVGVSRQPQVVDNIGNFVIYQFRWIQTQISIHCLAVL